MILFVKIILIAWAVTLILMLSYSMFIYFKLGRFIKKLKRRN
jgi:hypothetical protein